VIVLLDGTLARFRFRGVFCASLVSILGSGHEILPTGISVCCSRVILLVRHLECY
jgi:hypothetical protein